MVNWKFIGEGFYYKAVGTNGFKFTFNEAQLHCKENGGKIAEPQNRQESDDMDKLPELNFLWIGIKQYPNCSMSYVSNNARVNESWPRIERNSICSGSSKMTKCASIDSLSTEWIFTDCNTLKKGFICEHTVKIDQFNTHVPFAK